MLIALPYRSPTARWASISNGESLGVPPADVARTEQPGCGVTILRDKLDVPHVYGQPDH